MSWRHQFCIFAYNPSANKLCVLQASAGECELFLYCKCKQKLRILLPMSVSSRKVENRTGTPCKSTLERIMYLYLSSRDTQNDKKRLHYILALASMHFNFKLPPSLVFRHNKHCSCTPNVISKTVCLFLMALMGNNIQNPKQSSGT